MEDNRYFVRLGGFFRAKYGYFDVYNGDRYAADSLFYKRKIPVKFKGEWVNDDIKYVFVLCSVKRKDIVRFEEALREIPNKMLLSGYTDYEEWCGNFLKGMKNKNERDIMGN